MKRSLRLLLACVSIASLALAQTPETVPTSSGETRTRPGPKPGDVAPDFTVVGPDGKEVKLSDFRGKTLLVDIWATWCGPCVASMPHNSEMAEKFAKDGLVILAVCADDSRANYDGWVKRNGATYKFLTAHDPAGKSDWEHSVFNTKYGVTGFPTLFLIDRDGKLVGTTGGGGKDENPYVTRLLAKGGVPIDTSHLPPEETGKPKSIPAFGKTMAMSTQKFGSFTIGTPVPDFKAVGPDGNDVELSDFKGKPVLLAFWTGGRAPGDVVATINQTYKDQGLVVLGINTATERADFDKWYAEGKTSLGHPVAWDPAGKAYMESISHMTFGAGMYPAYAMVDAKGNLVGGTIGFGEKVSATLRQLVQKAGLKLTLKDEESVKTLAADAAAKGGKSVPAAMIKAGPPPTPEEMAKAAARPALLTEGTVAPDFKMKNVSGKEMKLSDFKGKVVVLDFWATWCGPCVSSFPHTQKIAAKFKDQDVVVLASGTSDTAAAFQEWITKNQARYPDMLFTYDVNDKSSATYDNRASISVYGVKGIPTQFIIDRTGKIVASVVGNEGEHDTRTVNALAKAGVKIN